MRAQVLHAVVAFSSVCFFRALYEISFVLLRHPIYFKYLVNSSKRALVSKSDSYCGDYSSRIVSTVHAALITVALAVCLASLHSWSREVLTYDTEEFCGLAFAFSIGYFIHDLVVVLRWKDENWQAFTAHHVAAAIPYLIYDFVPGCHCGGKVLAMYLLVEVSTIPLNFMHFMGAEDAEVEAKVRSPSAISGENELSVPVKDNIVVGEHEIPQVKAAKESEDEDQVPQPRQKWMEHMESWCFWLLIGTWVPFRLVMPVMLLWIVYSTIIPMWWDEPNVDDKSRMSDTVLRFLCLIPAVVAAHLIAIFCWLVFIQVWIPEIRRRISLTFMHERLSVTSCGKRSESRDELELGLPPVSALGK